MRRLYAMLAAAVLVAAVWVSAAYAMQGSPHFVGTPTCSKSSTFTLTCSGKAAGLGSGPIVAYLTADSVSETVQCVNKGQKAPPGQVNSGSVVGPSQNITPHNGAITFSTTLSASTPSPADVCPDSGKNWTVKMLSATYHNVVLHIEQDGTEVLTYPFGDI